MQMNLQLNVLLIKNKDKYMEKFNIELQEYEIKNIIDALKKLIQ